MRRIPHCHLHRQHLLHRCGEVSGEGLSAQLPHDLAGAHGRRTHNVHCVRKLDLSRALLSLFLHCVRKAVFDGLLNALLQSLHLFARGFEGEDATVRLGANAHDLLRRCVSAFAQERLDVGVERRLWQMVTEEINCLVSGSAPETSAASLLAEEASRGLQLPHQLISSMPRERELHGDLPPVLADRGILRLLAAGPPVLQVSRHLVDELCAFRFVPHGSKCLVKKHTVLWPRIDHGHTQPEQVSTHRTRDLTDARPAGALRRRGDCRHDDAAHRDVQHPRKCCLQDGLTLWNRADTQGAVDDLVGQHVVAHCVHHRGDARSLSAADGNCSQVSARRRQREGALVQPAHHGRITAIHRVEDLRMRLPNSWRCLAGLCRAVGAATGKLHCHGLHERTTCWCCLRHFQLTCCIVRPLL
mmetsp:Transcript_66021/g.124917  ORF Transcript_66021/g.124917 Transcript_66021/m.124917 type:complete len:415 (-) Transcript_66021:856-2100(-)